MILDDIVAAKKKRLAENKKECSLEQMKALAKKVERKPFSFYEALKKPGLSIIGEFKKASPSMGKIDGLIPLEQRIDEYNASVDAISCLTEEDYFNGSVEYLKNIRRISNLPIIRKDFVIDPYQIYEARVIGADCILLIAAILTDEQLKEYYQIATLLNLDCLVEVHNEEEAIRALKIKPKIIGVNNRNLKDFTISLEHTKAIRPMISKEIVFVSESGVTTKEDIAYLRRCEVDALLIGRTLMESNHPKEIARCFKEQYAKG